MGRDTTNPSRLKKGEVMTTYCGQRITQVEGNLVLEYTPTWTPERKRIFIRSFRDRVRRFRRVARELFPDAKIRVQMARWDNWMDLPGVPNDQVYITLKDGDQVELHLEDPLARALYERANVNIY